MNILTGTLARQEMDDSLSICWSPSNNISFDISIKKLGHKIIPIDYIYFGYYSPQIVVCNNKILHYNICKTISIQYHVPIIIIDHSMMDTFINYEKIQYIDEDINAIKVAVSPSVSKSWNNIHNITIDYSNAKEWENLFYEVSKRIYKL